MAAEGRFSVGIGRETPAHSPLRVDVSEGHAGSTLRAELRGVSVTDLTFGKLRDDRALIDATLDLPPEGEGRFSGVVRGLTLPAQAASAMGSSIAVTAHVLPARDAWHLRQVAVVAGVVRLGGEGVIALRQDHAALSVKLAGSVPCSALAGSALSANLGGGLIGGLIGGLARVAVTGDVAVSLQIEADSRNPGGASVKRTVGVGCGVGL